MEYHILQSWTELHVHSTKLQLCNIILPSFPLFFDVYHLQPLYNFSAVAWAAEQSIFDPRLTRDMLFRVCTILTKLYFSLIRFHCGFHHSTLLYGKAVHLQNA
jgi:uncharacterized protein YlaN (UPF0358 family)